MIMGDAESDEHLRIFKCLIDTGSHVLRNAIGIKLLNNNSIRFVKYLENNKHQYYHQFEKNTRRKCCLGSPHGCIVNGIMDKKIFYKVYNKTAEQNTHDCLDRFEIKAGISLDILDLSDLNFFLWNSGTLSTQEENSLMKIMSIRSAICHPSSSHSYSINELEIYWSDLKSAVLLFAEPKCYKDIVEMQIETLQNCKLNVIESAKIIQKMKTESDKILHAIQQNTPLKIVDIEKLLKDGNYGLENCVRSENNKMKSYINDTFQEFKESEQRVCQTVIQSRGHLVDKLIEEQNKSRNHTVELNADLMEKNRKLTAEVKDVKTEIKELKTILIGYIGKQKVDLVMNTEQIEKSTESPDKRKVDFTAKVNQIHVTEDKENEIIEKLPPEVKIQTKNDSSPEAAVTETIEITGKKVNSIILELKATPGILHSVETFKAAILILVQAMQTAGGIDVEIDDTITVNLRFESPLTEDQFTVVKCLFAKEWNDDNDATQLADEYSSISDEYLSIEDVREIDFRPELDIYSKEETSEVVQPETIEAVTKTSCQYCDDKDKIIRTLEEQNENVDMLKSRNEQYNKGLQEENSKLKHVVKGIQEENSKLKALLRRTREYNTGITEKLIIMKQEELKGEDLSSLEPEQKYYLRKEDNRQMDSSSKTKLYECRDCYEKNDIIIQLDRRLCEIRRRIIEAKRKSLSGNIFFEDLLTITQQNTSMTSVEDKGRMKDKELKSDISSQKSELIYDSDVRNPKTEAKMNLMELQHSKVPGAGFDQPEDKSELSLRISELRLEYATDAEGFLTESNTGPIASTSVLPQIIIEKSKITKLPNSKENSKRKVLYKMAKSKAHTHQTNGKQLSYSGLARNLYTKTEEQQGLAIILHGKRTSYFSHSRDPDIPHLQEFFEEMGFVVRCIDGIDYRQSYMYMADEKFYCIFVILTGYDHGDFTEFYGIHRLLYSRVQGKPMICMTNSISSIRKSYQIKRITQEPNTLMVSPFELFRDPYNKEFNIFKDFIKVTRNNRFADIMDILTRMNAQYDRPAITFQSTLRKKFCFL